MKEKLLSLGLGVLFAASALTVSADVQMTAEYKVGDSMGSGSVTAKTNHFYNGENRLIRGANTVIGYDGVEVIGRNYYYTYDENGKLTSTYNYQWQEAYEKWSAVKDTTVYTYDEKGRLAKMETEVKGWQYEYDDQDRLIHEYYYSIRYGDPEPISNTYYTKFDENGNPIEYNGDGDSSSYRFDGTMSYDEQGRLVEVKQFSLETGAQKNKIEYTYDDFGICTLELHYRSGSSKPDTVVAGSEADTLRYNKAIAREALGNGWYHLTNHTYSVVAGWTGSSTSYKELYVDLKGEYAPRNLVVENISTKENPQTVKVTFDVPATLPVDNVSYAIWRSGTLAGTATAVDGKVEFIDKGMEVGTYDYIVQTYDATNDVFYNTSDIVTVDVSIPLAKAINVRVNGGYWGTYEDSQTSAYDSFFIKLAWDVEETDLEIKGYRVWVYPWAYAMKEISGDVRSCELSMTDAECADIRIDVVYEHGIKEGEYVPLFWNTVDFEGEPELKYYLVNEEKWGDHMGGTGASSIAYYIYDHKNNLSRRVDYGYNTDGSKSPLYHYFYNYNTSGQIISEYYLQMNALGEWGKPKLPYVYTYDAQGRLIAKEDTTGHTLYEYTYDMYGRLQTMTNKGKNFGSTEYDKLRSTTYYKEYNNQGLCTYEELVHAIYASSSYNTTYTYDEKGNMLSMVQLTPNGLAYDKYEYEYDKYGVQISATRSKPVYDGSQLTDQFALSSRTVREAQETGKYKKYDETYNASTDTWTPAKRYSIEIYSPINGSLAPKNLKVRNISTADQPNTVEVEANYPTVKLANAEYIIWRGWIPVDTVAAPASQGVISFHDVDVANGTYEYFVQTYNTATGQAFNATAPATFTFDIELPAVTNLHKVTQTEGTFFDADLGISHPVYWIHFAWDAPETDLKVERYNIYQDGYKIPMSYTTNTNDSVWVYRQAEEDMENQELSTRVAVTAVYDFGESEWTEEIFEIVPSSLDNVTFEGSAYVAGKTLFVEPQAQVTIYNVGGSVVATYNNNTAIDLAELPVGVYLAVVKVGDTNQIVKVAL